VPVYSSRYTKDSSLVAMGDAIRRARKALGIAQEELALRAELDRSYLGGVERGESNATLLNIVKISAALGMNPSQLLEQAGL
jgi:transcriptional regulator with XRE-family HTH domain